MEMMVLFIFSTVGVGGFQTITSQEIYGKQHCVEIAQMLRRNGAKDAFCVPKRGN